MPVYYNDGLDDPVQYDRQASFVGGQISNFRENLLNESQAESLKDLDAPKNGVLKSRRGFHRFADLLGSSSASVNTQALAYFDTDAKESLIAFVNSNAYAINSSGTVSVSGLGTGFTNSTTNRVYTCQVADKLFFASHSNNNRIGQISWDTSGSAFVVKEIADGPTNSKYLVNNNFRIFAYQPSDDQIYVSEFLPNYTQAIGSLTITNGGTGYTAGTLSATGGGGSGFAGTYTVDAGVIKTVTITNGGSGYTSLPTIVPSHAGDGNAVIAPAYETTFGGAANLPFKVGLGDPVTGLASWVGFNLVVFCKNSCYVVDTGGTPAANGNAPTTADFTIRTISATTGCVSHGSIAQVGEDLFFLSRTGVRSIRRTMEENMVASDVGVISYPIQDVIDQINWAAVENATSIFWNNRYLLSVPTGASTVNDTTLVYNTNTQSWMGVWRGDVTVTSGVPASTINPYQYAVTQFSGGKPYLISLDKVGNPLQYRDFVEDKNQIKFTASHNGYEKKFGCIHKREISIEKQNGKLIGSDEIIKKKDGKPLNYSLRFHLYPGLTAVKTMGGNSALIQISKNKSLIFTILDESILLEKSIFLGGNKILDNTCVTVSGNLVNKNKTIHWEIKKNI